MVPCKQALDRFAHDDATRWCAGATGVSGMWRSWGRGAACGLRPRWRGRYWRCGLDHRRGLSVSALSSGTTTGAAATGSTATTGTAAELERRTTGAAGAA